MDTNESNEDKKITYMTILLQLAIRERDDEMSASIGTFLFYLN